MGINDKSEPLVLTFDNKIFGIPHLLLLRLPAKLNYNAKGGKKTIININLLATNHSEGKQTILQFISLTSCQMISLKASDKLRATAEGFTSQKINSSTNIILSRSVLYVKAAWLPLPTPTCVLGQKGFSQQPEASWTSKDETRCWHFHSALDKEARRLDHLRELYQEVSAVLLSTGSKIPKKGMVREE